MAEVKIGTITHFFPKVNAGVVKFEGELKVGDKIKIKGKRAGEDFEFEQSVDSLQKDREAVEVAKSGDELGMKVSEEVKEGDEVFKIE